MATSADIAVQSSNYTGNAQLGGAGGEAFKLDLKPLEQLVAYTNLQNKTFWEQKQKNADKLVDKLASITSLDVNDLYGSDRDKMIDEMTAAKSKVADALRDVPSDPSEYAKWYANAQDEIGKISGKYATRKQRTIDRSAQIALIQQKYPNNPRAQDAAIKVLDDQFSNTDGKLENVPLWQATPLPEMPIPTSTLDVYHTGEGNMDVKSSLTVFNIPAVFKAATQISVLGFNQQSKFPSKTIKDGTGKEVPNPAYATWAKGKTQREINYAEMQNVNADADETKQLLASGVSDFKSVVAKYYDDNGVFDEAKFRKENAGNTVLLGNLDAAQKLTAYAKTLKANMTNGTMVSGELKYKLPQSISTNDLDQAIVDDFRNITPEQLLASHAFLGYAGDKVENKEIMTNSADEAKARANSLQIARENNANEMAKAMLPYKMAKKMAGATGQQLQQAASDSGNLLYGVNTPKNINVHTLDGKTIPNVSIKNGAVVDAKGAIVTDYSGDLKLPAGYFNNSMITEYYKVAGKDAPAIFVQNGKYTARFKNGVIVGLQTVTDNSESGVGGSFIDENQFRHITEQASQINVSAKDYPDVNYGVKPTVADEEYQKILEEIKNMK